MTKVGVFDSGIGGLSVATAIENAFPEFEVIFVNDTENIPYGTKTPEQMVQLTAPKMKYLIDYGCEVIVIACNTVTTNIIDTLRSTYDVQFIGIEPMVKPASEQTKTGIITVCATPATLKSKRYAWLKSEFASGFEVIEPDCSDWTRMIETNTLDLKKIKKIIDDSCNAGSDMIVLGCTHYHWIEDLIRRLADGRAVVIQPEQSIVQRLRSFI